MACLMKILYFFLTYFKDNKPVVSLISNNINELNIQDYHVGLCKKNHLNTNNSKYFRSKTLDKEKNKCFDTDLSLHDFSKQNKDTDSKEDRLRKTENSCIEESSRFSFRAIQPFEKETKYTGRSIIDYGYQETDIWDRPSNTYIRFIEESEETLANKVEYDMDEQDDFWLEHYNSKRLKLEGDTISHEFFEIVLTRIEKEWIELDKRIPKDASKENLSSDDSKCSICDDGECENINAIVFCDGCNLAVHQDCYGIPYIPEGQWLCRKCIVSPQNTLNCIFCPNTSGAFKQTSDNRWAHLLCAMWIPEVTVANPVYQEPIDNIHKIPSSRWKLICYICQQKMGASIQCMNKSCYKAFHVTCARRAKLYMPMKKNSTELKAYCDKHVPNFWRNEHNITKFLHDTRNYFLSHTVASQSSVNNYNSNYTRNPSSKIYINLKKTKTYPLIPMYIQRKILTYIHKFPIRKKAIFITDICKYWSLKRESRKNATLIKRFQLKIEDDRVYNLSDNQLLQRIKFAENLKNDLEKLLQLIDAVKKREEEKKKISYYLETVADCLYFPITHVVRNILNCIKKWDKNKLFSHIPINSLSNNSIVENNSPDTIYYKTAIRFKRQCEKIFSDAENYTSFLKTENNRMVSNWSIFEPKGLSIKEYVQLWPGDDIREMSPLSEITEEEFRILEQPIFRETYKNTIRHSDNYE
ncbi:hypothetical protein PMAC_000510 [Pneumocystis sp. 'macacae']|nr:hypothetical protein PMAC_000510 [Pneumocystis sp. 'macacae']